MLAARSPHARRTLAARSPHARRTLAACSPLVRRMFAACSPHARRTLAERANHDARVTRDGIAGATTTRRVVECARKKLSRWYLRDFGLYTIV